MMTFLLSVVVAVLVVVGLALLARGRRKVQEEDSDRSGKEAFREAVAALPGPLHGHAKKEGFPSHVPLVTQAGGLARFVQDLHAQHGPVVAFCMGPLSEQVMVSVCDPTLLRATLRLGSRPTHLFQFLEPLLGENNIQVLDAAHAKDSRRALSSVVAHRRLTSSYVDLLAHAKTLMDGLCAKGASAVVGLQDELLRFALPAALSVFAGDSVTAINMEAFRAAYDATLTNTFEAQLGFSELRQQQLDDSLKFLRDTVDAIIAAKRAHLVKNGPSADREEADLVELVCTSNDPDTKLPYDQEKIRSLVLAYLLAAYHTSVVATSWALFLLTQNPQVQAKVQQEVDDVLQGRQPSVADLDKLTYTAQVLKEAMRVYTPGPFGARVVDCAEGLVVGPHRLPQGCTVLYPLGLVHRNPDLWPEPSRFNPDRFAPDNKIPPLAFVPFGMGPRICPGERMAWLEMRLLLVLFMQKFTVELATPADHVITEERFTLWAKDDIKVHLIPRSA